MGSQTQGGLTSWRASPTLTSGSQDGSRGAASYEVVQGILRRLPDLGAEAGRYAKHSSQRRCKREVKPQPNPSDTQQVRETRGAAPVLLWQKSGERRKIRLRLQGHHLPTPTVRLALAGSPAAPPRPSQAAPGQVLCMWPRPRHRPDPREPAVLQHQRQGGSPHPAGAAAGAAGFSAADAAGSGRQRSSGRALR